ERLVQFYDKKGQNLKEISKLPEGGGWLLVQFGADSRKEADDRARAFMDRLRRKPDAPNMKLYDDPAEEKRIWEVRESALAGTAWVPGEPATWPGWEDSAVSPDRVGDYLRDLHQLFSKHGYHPAIYGHLGQG